MDATCIDIQHTSHVTAKQKHTSREPAIAGVDEVGYGALAGPVVVAAVLLSRENTPSGIKDSKRLSPKKREELADILMANHIVCVVFACNKRIDLYNIRRTTLWAMSQAINSLTKTPDIALIDGKYVPTNLICNAKAIISGDATHLEIAAASIVAKVCRDRHMTALAAHYPEYCFEKHMGYSTKLHMELLLRYGACRIHRLSYAPLRNLECCLVKC